MTRLSLIVCLLLTFHVVAQDEPRPLRPLPVGDVLLNLPSNQMAAHGQWEWKFTHRFNQSLDDGDLFHSFLGLDSNADIVFGASYAMRPNLQLSLVRSNANDTYEAAAKWVVLRQTEGHALTTTVRGGADMRTEENLEDRTSFFAQAIVSRQFGKKAEIFFLPTIATEAGRAVTGDTSGALFEYAFNIPVGVVWMMRPGFALVGEVIPPNTDLPDTIDADFGWALGIKRNIGGHWFEILVTNNQSTLVDQYVTTTYQGSGLNSGDIKLGFNIERRFGRRK